MSESFTYESEAHSSLSTIDHIICPHHLLPSFCSSSPLQDLPLNTSDHHPVCATLRCTFSSTISHRDHPNYSPPNWSGCSKDVIFSTYTSPLQPILHDLMLVIPPLSALSHEPLLIDKHLESVTTSLLSVGVKLPCKRYHPHQSPAWTPQLKAASTTRKRLYRNWVSCGRPRDPANPLRKAYKDAKKNFRSKLRLHRRTINDNFFASLDIDCSNPQRFFSKIRRHINPSSADLPTQRITYNNTVYEGDSLLDGWASYFESLVFLLIFLSLQPKLRSPTNCSLFYTLLLTLLNFSPRKKSLLIFIHCHQRKLLDPTRLRINI